MVILSAYDDEHYVRAALAAGVSGYLLKTTAERRTGPALARCLLRPTGRPRPARGQGEKDLVGRGPSR